MNQGFFCCCCFVCISQLCNEITENGNRVCVRTAPAVETKVIEFSLTR